MALLELNYNLQLCHKRDIVIEMIDGALDVGALDAAHSVTGGVSLPGADAVLRQLQRVRSSLALQKSRPTAAPSKELEPDWWAPYLESGYKRGALSTMVCDCGMAAGGKSVVGPMKPATGYMMRQENGDVIGPIPETLLRFGLQHGELSPSPAPTSDASSSSDAAHSMVAAALAGVATMRGAGGKGGDDERKAEEADVYQRLANSAAADDQAKDELQRMRQAAAVRQWDQLRSEQLHAKNEVLRRLLSAPTDVAGALHMKLTNPGFHTSLMTVKRALDEAALAGVRGAGATTKSDVFKTAMAHLDTARAILEGATREARGEAGRHYQHQPASLPAEREEGAVGCAPRLQQ